MASPASSPVRARGTPQRPAAISPESFQSSQDFYFSRNTTYDALPDHFRGMVTKRQYQASYLDYAVSRQLAWRQCHVCTFTSESAYYERVVRSVQGGLLLYPYHLQGDLVRVLGATPPVVYRNMLAAVLKKEKGFDSIPNFPATDIRRVLAIGRNEHINLLERMRGKAFQLKSKVLRNAVHGLLPSESVFKLCVEHHWWKVRLGRVSMDMFHSLEPDERSVLSTLKRRGECFAGELDLYALRRLYRADCIFFDVPISKRDVITLPPLQSFVMNRLSGDRFEKLLYSMFVSMDGQTTVEELARILQLPVPVVVQVVSVYCRLGMAIKLNPPPLTMDDEGRWHHTWMVRAQYVSTPPTTPQKKKRRPPRTLGDELNVAAAEASDDTPHKLCILFDDTLPSVLMLGNLSQSLKSHAITLFEVGRLTDANLHSFSDELHTIDESHTAQHGYGECDAFEGEAMGYLEYALALRDTIGFFLHYEGADIDEFDLMRFDTLMGLDAGTRRRLLTRTYSCLLALAPIAPAQETLPQTSKPPFLGPPVPEVTACAPLFHMFVYDEMGCGPPTLLLHKLTNERAHALTLPPCFDDYTTLRVSSFRGEEVFVERAELHDALHKFVSDGSALVQGRARGGFAAVDVHVALPPTDTHAIGAVQALVETASATLPLSATPSYMTVAQVDADTYVPWAVNMGVPLFSRELNACVLYSIRTLRLLNPPSRAQHSENMWRLTLRFLSFMERNVGERVEKSLPREWTPSCSLLFTGRGRVSIVS